MKQKEKYCSKCGVQNDLIKYAKSIYKGTVHQYYRCNKCNAKKQKKYYKTKIGQKNTYRAIKKSIKKYWKKQLARQYVYEATKRGELIRPKNCELCGNSGTIQAHHKDYSKPLEVIWLCIKCHSQEDKKVV